MVIAYNTTINAITSQHQINQQHGKIVKMLFIILTFKNSCKYIIVK